VITNLLESARLQRAYITADENKALTESFVVLSQLPDEQLQQVLAEADLTASDAARIFKAAVAMRQEKGFVAKAKDAYVNSADKISGISKQVKRKISALIQKSESTTAKIAELINQGGAKANETIDIIDSKVDAQVLKTRSAAQRLPGSYVPISAEITEIQKIAKGSPQYSAFAVSSLASAENMMQRNVSLPSIVLYLSTVSEVMKGKKLSASLEKALSDIGATGTASVSESDFNESEEIGRVRELAGLRVDEKFGLGKKPELDYEELLSTWNKRGRPTDIDEIKRILTTAGLSNREISRAFKKADVDTGEGSDFKIAKLSGALKKADLASYVIDYLEDMHPKDISESVSVNEAKINDSQIKKVLLQISRVYSSSDQSQSKAVRRYLKKFTAQFSNANDPEDKERIAGEAVNYLHDRQNYDEYNDAVNAVTKYIRNSDLENDVKQNILSAISNKTTYKARRTVKQEPVKAKPRARVTPSADGKPRVRPAVESLTLSELQELFEDAIVRDMKSRYGRIKREALRRPTR